MAIPAPAPTPVTLAESLSSMMDIDVHGEEEEQQARGDGGQQQHEHEPAMKKVKRVHGEVEMVLRQTAEMVMVLVGVGALRGGAQPSPLECQLAIEAYEKLATLVAFSAPQDLVSKDALQSLIQQLTAPPPPPARTKPVAAILSQPALPSSPVPSPVSKAPAQAPVQAATTPSPSPSPSLSPLPSPAPVSSTPSAQTSESEAAAPAAPKSDAAASAPPVSKASTSSKATTKAVSPSPPAAVGKTKALEDVQSSAPALATPSASNTNTPAATSAAPKGKPGGRTSPVKQPTTETQPTPTTTVTIKDLRGNQAPKALARQRGLKNLMNSEPPAPPPAAAPPPPPPPPPPPAPPVVLDPQQTHQQLALAVHQLLKPHIPTPGLAKSQLTYISAAIPCGICKVVVNATNNVLVCDGCEGGFHLQCLQLSSSQNVPKSDWYCPKCVTANGGRPQAPKYGPLRRGPAGLPAPKNSWAMQAGCGSDTSKGQTPPGKLLLQSRKKDGDAAETSNTPNSEEAEHGASVASTTTRAPKAAQIGAVDESMLTVAWVGPLISSCQDKLYYSACSVGGETLRLQDTAFFRPEAPGVPPYIARLQALWEDKSSGQKWVKVNWCYYPSDLPVNMGRPVTSDPREVYESNHSDNNLVGSIQGPCLVLSPLQYQEEVNRRSKNTTMENPMPLFLCQWYYDAPRGLFRASSDVSS